MAEVNKQDQAKKEADRKAVEDVRRKAEDEAKAIVEQAKKEAEGVAEQILEDARGQANDVVFKGVSKKQLIDGYEKGLNHMQLADKYFGSASEENIKKVADVINPKYEIFDDIDQDVQVEEVN